ncbi:MAG: DUF2970 domain-containing protein [Alcanivorax sp.]|nr:DUF2970 domain-containing protein [Alcanivorax sp.]
MSDDNAPNDDDKPGLLQTLHSTLAAMFGVQSDRNRQRDFKGGDASQFIGVFIVVVIALVIGMIMLVHTVMEAAPNAGQ